MTILNKIKENIDKISEKIQKVEYRYGSLPSPDVVLRNYENEYAANLVSLNNLKSQAAKIIESMRNVTSNAEANDAEKKIQKLKEAINLSLNESQEIVRRQKKYAEEEYAGHSEYISLLASKEQLEHSYDTIKKEQEWGK